MRGSDSNEVGTALCEAWGLDPGEVLRIAVIVGPGDPPYANVDLLLNGEVVRRLLDLRLAPPVGKGDSNG